MRCPTGSKAGSWDRHNWRRCRALVSKLKGGNVSAYRQFDAHGIVSTFLLIVFLQFLAQRVGLSPDDGILTGGIIVAAVEDPVRDHILVEMGRFAAEGRLTHKTKETRVTLGANECVSLEN